MGVASFVARRYIQSHRGQRFFSAIIGLSIVGIAIGVAAMIVVLSVINGFERELRSGFLAANAHIMAFHYPAGLENYQQWINTIEKDFGADIKGMSPFVNGETMVRKDTLMHSILIRGVYPSLREKVQDAKIFLRPPTALDALQKELDSPTITGAPAIVLGSGLASLLSAKVGDTVKLVAPQSEDGGDQREFRVVGLYDSGLKHYDNKIGIMSLKTAQQFFGVKERVTGLEIGLKDPDKSSRLAAKMEEAYAITIKDWMSFNKPMFEAMEMERSVIALVVALVAFVASFNILTTLFISVTQKQKSISVMKALGASNGMIQRLFLMQGAIVGMVGSVAGIFLALLISWVLERYPIIDLPDPYLLAKLPIEYDYKVYLFVAVSGVLICVVAGLYPAFSAGRVNITEGLRGRAPIQ